MTEVFSSRDSATIGLLQSLLEAEGIRTYLRSEHAATVTYPAVVPALCILDEADVERGVELIRENLRQGEAGSEEEHTCPQCGEKSPGGFEKCWSCETFLIVAG
ncbi:DUF2007 domain-containing protein [Luteolibacter yonseiensis]|uniref:DUF2007 domain-containing protein n=1 Tax=Luteolibacter yonseiensis TaxID=1144680 RepID=A0A934R2J8_9BACT|nr:DUF2007 domain-containing protein [Luteolibacter yonseiensis]MBK1814099.1 DUF2007 domain-containing protein [Luteolibacter yonseiensis]